MRATQAIRTATALVLLGVAAPLCAPLAASAAPLVRTHAHAQARTTTSSTPYSTAPTMTHPSPARIVFTPMRPNHAQARATTSTAPSPVGPLSTLYNHCTSSPCPVTNAQLTDQGGPLLTRPSVWFVNFSSSSSALSPSAGFVPGTFASTEPSAAGATNAILDSPYFTSWATEYSRPNTGEMIMPGSYAGTVTLLNPQLATASVLDNTDITAALASAELAGQLPALGPSTMLVLWFRAGQEITVKAQSMTSLTDFCGYHTATPVKMPDYSYTYIPFAVMPNEATNSGCGFAATDFGSMTYILSHEIAEAVTDPGTAGPTWTSSLTGDEAGDLCSTGSALPIYSLTGHVYEVTPIFAQTWALDTTSGHNAQIWGCYAQRSPVILTATWDPAAGSPSSTSTIHVKLIGPNGPVAGAWVTALDASGIYLSRPTLSDGTALINLLSPEAVSTLSLFFYGTSTLAPAYTQLAGILASPALNAPTVSGTSATFTWSDPAGVTPDYHVVLLSNGRSCASSSTSCTISSIDPTQSYTAWLSSYEGTSASAPSSTTLSFPSPPPSTPVTTTTSSSTVTVTWVSPANGTLLSAWVNPSSESCSVTAPVSSCTITGLAPATSYTLTATVTNAYGTSPGYTTTVTTSAGGPSAPTSVHAQSGNTQLAVTWSPPTSTSNLPVLSYTATATSTSPPASTSCTSATTSCSITGLTNGVAYVVTATATTAAGTSPPSSPSSPAVPLGRPTPPQLVHATSNASTLMVSWSAPASTGGLVSNYLAVLSPGGHVCATATTTCTFTHLIDFAAYSVSVTARNPAGPSSPAVAAGLFPHRPFSLHLALPTTTWAYQPVTTTVITSPAVPGRAVTLSAPGVYLREPTDASGRATFTFTPPIASARTYTATLANVAAAAPLAVHYAFAGFYTQSLRPHTTAIIYSVSTPTLTLSSAQLTALVRAGQAGILVTSPDGTTATSLCTAVTGTWLVCPVSLPDAAVTVTAQLGGAGAWYAPASPRASSSAQVGAELLGGTALFVGQALHSANNAYTATFTAAGQLVVTTANGTAVCTVGAPSAHPAQLDLTTTGLLEVLDTSNRVVDSSHTSSPGATLVLTNAGNLELHATTGAVLWTSARNGLS